MYKLSTQTQTLDINVFLLGTTHHFSFVSFISTSRHSNKQSYYIKFAGILFKIII